MLFRPPAIETSRRTSSRAQKLRTHSVMQSAAQVLSSGVRMSSSFRPSAVRITCTFAALKEMVLSAPSALTKSCQRPHEGSRSVSNAVGTGTCCNNMHLIRHNVSFSFEGIDRFRDDLRSHARHGEQNASPRVHFCRHRVKLSFKRLSWSPWMRRICVLSPVARMLDLALIGL